MLGAHSPVRWKARWRRKKLAKFFNVRFYGFTLLSLAVVRSVTSVSTEGNGCARGWASPRTCTFTRNWKTMHERNRALYVCIATRRVPLFRELFYHLLICPDVFYDKIWQELFGVPNFCVSHQCLSRFGKSHYVYAEFVLGTLSHVSRLNLAPPALSASGKVAVLIEPRQHPLLKYVVKQVMSTLGPEWGLQLFLSDENFDTVSEELEIYPGKSGEHIRVINLRDFGFRGSEMHDNVIQSGLSMHNNLYERVVGEFILWFQLDVVLRHSLSSDMFDRHFLGSEWRHCEFPTCDPSVCPNVCGGGNSGLSFRRRSTFLRIATAGQLPADLWGVKGNVSFSHQGFLSDALYDNTGKDWFQDDLIISHKLSVLGMLPTDGMNQKFAIGETIGRNSTHVDPVGLHKPWSAVHISPDVIIQLLDEPFQAIIRRAVQDGRRKSFAQLRHK